MVQRPWSDLHSHVHQSLQRRFPQVKASHLLIAVSGGQDSLCLVQLLQELTPLWHWKLSIAHCDHGWPTDAGIADHVAQFAQQHSLPYFQEQAFNLPQTEAAARHWRYQALTAIAEQQGISFVLTAHTLTDRAETLLFNLMRGSGSDGLKGMDWQRALSPQVTLLRPLLTVTRQETGRFCQERQLPVWTDVLNQDLRYRRNRIRQDVMPYLQTHFNSQVERSLAQTVEILSAEVDYLHQQMLSVWGSCYDSERQALNRLTLRKIPLALQRRVIHYWLRQQRSQAPNFEHIEAVVHLIAAPNRSQTSTLPGGRHIFVQGDWLVQSSMKTSNSQ